MRPDSLFSIAPHAPFLPTLAERVLDGTLLAGWRREGPFWLSDVTIILPTRRARPALAAEFARRLGGAALLPDIRTFGGEEADEEPFLPPFEAPEPPPPAGRLERTLTLARLVDAWARTPDGQQVLATPPNAAEILTLAASLGSLADDLTIERVSPAAIRALPPEALAENWQQVLKFLGIALDAWPALLAERGRADAAALRNERLARRAEAAALIYADRPVIAAGSTGSIPATADLLAAIARLPRGTVVLPGLDTTLSPEAHERLLDPLKAPHGHPQYGLARLLRHLGTTHGVVTELAAADTPRTGLVRRALALAEDTALWAAARRDDDAAGAMAGVATLAARTEEEQARAIAVAARAALAEGRSVGIVSPDQTLSRRIAAELLRFDIAVDDAAGIPLFQSAAGRLLRQIIAAVAERLAPVALVSLLQNPATILGLERAEVSRLAAAIDRDLLRGQYPRAGVAGLRALLARRPVRPLEVGDLFDRLEAALAPLEAIARAETTDARQLALALRHAVVSISGVAGIGPGGREFFSWADDLANGPETGPAFAPVALEGVLAALLAGISVQSPVPARTDIAIWGRLEARLQSPGLLILAGLNEDVWPGAADPGPWLSRGMRLAAGLDPPERQQGQAAHDFEMALGNSEVLLAFAARRGTAPALPSRYVQRLEAVLGKDGTDALRARGTDWLGMARRLDAVAGDPVPAGRPLPSPPRAARPVELSVTEVETLFRSPYDIYARRVLRLKPLMALGEVPDARERGSMIHEVFARFVREGHDFAAADAQQRMMAMAEEKFAGLEAIGERRDIWLRRFVPAAREFLAFEQERNAQVRQRHAEIDGRWAFPLGFTLTGRADRIDELNDGSVEIIDFKTGSIPSPKQMKAFEAPQLLLEAAMVRGAGFAGIASAPASALTYLKVGLGPEALTAAPFKPQEGFDLPAAAQHISERLQRHVDALLLSDTQPLGARIRPDLSRRYKGAYDHLARTDEWTLAAGDDSE